MDTIDLAVPMDEQFILATVQQFAPRAAIVGGFLRDLAAGVQPKDLDIFVPAPFVLPEVFFKHLRKVYHGGYGTGMRKEVLRVYELSYSFFLPVQLVVNTAPNGEEAIKLVDFDFCQIAYDGEKVSVGPGFARALETKTATYMLPNGPDMERSIRRAEKWQAGKFKDWDFRFPQGEFDV